MTCPSCGSPATKQEVHKTMDHHVENLRMRRCLCGARWVTVERLKRGTLVVTDGSHVTMTKVTRDLPVTLKRVTRNPPVTLGGVGGGVSSGLFPGLDLSGPSQQSGSGCAIHVGPSDFDVFWKAYPRKTHKGDAEKAWKVMGPPLADVLAALVWQRALFDWRKEGGRFVPYPATYLNAKGWLDEPQASTSVPSGPIAWPHLQGAK